MNSKDCLNDSAFNKEVVDYLGKSLNRLLKFVSLEQRNETVRITYLEYSIDGSKTVKATESQQSNNDHGSEVIYSPLNFLDRRILFVHNFLNRFFKICTAYNEQTIINPDSFYLKNLTAWATIKISMFNSLFTSPASICNADCVFCYERGNPLPYARLKPRVLSMDEVITRLKLYNTDTGRGFSPGFERYMEPFVNQHIIEILKFIKSRNPSFMIEEITTNASLLTDRLIDDLGSLKPIFLAISLNSTSSLRSDVMGLNESLARRGVEVIGKLRKQGIPFLGSIVAWPSLLNGDLEETIKFLDENQALFIRVNLPSFSKYNFPNQAPFDLDDVWPKVVEIVNQMKHKIKTPVVAVPSLYYEDGFIPKVDGIVINSPASVSGLKLGDIVQKVNDEQIFSRAQLRAALNEHWQAEKDVHLIIERDSSFKEVIIKYNPKQTGVGYPFLVEYSFILSKIPYGVFTVDGFRLFYVNYIQQILRENKPACALVITSKLIKPILLKAIEKYNNFSELKESLINEVLNIVTPVNDYWGGNVILGDLYMLGDIDHCISNWVSNTGRRPEIVIMPSSILDSYGFDPCGSHYSYLEYKWNLKIKFIPVERITY